MNTFAFFRLFNKTIIFNSIKCISQFTLLCAGIPVEISDLSPVNVDTDSQVDGKLVNYSRPLLKNMSAMKRPIISGQHITGLTDAEGSFGISITTKSEGIGAKIGTQFKITQQAHSEPTLRAIQKYFQNVGSIYVDNKKDGSLKYQVSDRNDLVNTIIPHFDNNKLLTSKVLDYNDFRTVVHMLSNKEHFSKEGLDTIRVIKEHINSNRP